MNTMNTFKQGSFHGHEAKSRALPVIALGNIAFDIVWCPWTGDTRTMEQRAIDRWENEGGEIPNETKKRTQFVKWQTLRSIRIPLIFQK